LIFLDLMTKIAGLIHPLTHWQRLSSMICVSLLIVNPLMKFWQKRSMGMQDQSLFQRKFNVINLYLTLRAGSLLFKLRNTPWALLVRWPRPNQECCLWSSRVSPWEAEAVTNPAVWASSKVLRAFFETQRSYNFSIPPCPRCLQPGPLRRDC
jgi:hypothetical protein